MRTRALLVLAATFFFSFIGRFAVMASDIQAIAKPHSEDSEVSEGQNVCIEPSLAAAVRSKLTKLEEDEASLIERKKELQLYDRQIAERLRELETANAQFSSYVAARKSAQASDVAKLAAIYEGMKPSQASAIMMEMDPKFAAGVLSSMSNDKASQVVASMDAEKAYLISVILANRSSSK